MGGGEVLEVTHLITNRGRARILRDVSLAVRENEVVCLVGRNGAGKTTTMDSIMGLLPVRAGAVRLRGQELTKLPAHQRAQRGIGYAPEDTGVFPDLTVNENLRDRKSTRLNSSHTVISYAVFCLKKKKSNKNVGIISHREMKGHKER